MSLAEVLLSTRLLGALLIYALLSVVIGLLAARVHAHVSHTPLEWPWERIWLPLLRAAALVAFLLLAYPLIFGLSEAEPVLRLLREREHGTSHLVNLVFLVALLMPVLPVLGRFTALVLPTQGILASALLFAWLGASLELDRVSYWPGALPLLAIVLLSIAAHWLARTASAYLREWSARTLHVADADELVFSSLLLMLQAPAIMIFSLSLGRQLP